MAAVLLSLVAAGVAALFSAQLARQYAARRRHHALAWAVSLGLFALASAAVAVGLGFGWSAPVFAVYWLAGALVTVPFLAAGQLMLLDPARSPLWWTLVGLATVWAVVSLPLSTIDAAALRAATAAGGIPVGADVLGDSLAHALLDVFNYTAVIVVVGTVWSAVRSRRWLVLLIAVGVMVAGASFAFVRAGQPASFSATLAGGVALMYAGFRAASQPPKVRGVAEPQGGERQAGEPQGGERQAGESQGGERQAGEPQAGGDAPPGSSAS